MSAFDLDIIFVNYNSTDDLIACLRSLAENPCRARLRIFVQDNASKDAPRRITEAFPEAELQINKKNIGLGGAINQAARRGDAPFIAMINPDSVIDGRCLDNCLQWLRDNPQVGAVGPKILNLDGTVQGSARAFPTAMTGLFGRSSLLSRLFPNNRFTARNVLTQGCEFCQPTAVDWVSLAAIVARRQAFEEAGMMDEDFFLFWEDADLCKRLWASGWKVYYYPHDSIVHKVGGSRKSRNIASLWNFHKSSYIFYRKHSNGVGAIAAPFVISLLGIRFASLCMLHFIRLPFAGRSALRR